jgi:hypothetical protein
MPAPRLCQCLGTKGRCPIDGFTKHEEPFELNSSSRTDTIVKTEAQLFSHARVNLKKPLCCVFTSPTIQYFSFRSRYFRVSVVQTTTIETLSYVYCSNSCLCSCCSEAFCSGLSIIFVIDKCQIFFSIISSGPSTGSVRCISCCYPSILSRTEFSITFLLFLCH